MVMEPKWDSVWDIFIWSTVQIPGLHQPSRIQPTVTATQWLWTHALIFILYLLWTLRVPVAHLFCSALRGTLMIFLHLSNYSAKVHTVLYFP